nr:probable anion transporter 3, chloroplastic [Ipomoea trifida]
MVPERFKVVALMACVMALYNADRVVMFVAVVPLAAKYDWSNAFLGVVQDRWVPAKGHEICRNVELLINIKIPSRLPLRLVVPFYNSVADAKSQIPQRLLLLPEVPFHNSAADAKFHHDFHSDGRDGWSPSKTPPPTPKSHGFAI